MLVAACAAFALQLAEALRGLRRAAALGVCVCVLSLAGTAEAAPPAGAAPAPSPEPGIYDLAVVDRVLHCAALEGNPVSAEDRELLTRELASLRQAFGAASRAGALAETGGTAARGGGAAPESQDCFTSQSAQCVRDLRLTRCEDLAAQMSAGAGGGLIGGGEPPTWARLYAAALAGKVRQCATAEQGRPPMPDEERLLGDFAGRMAGVLAMFTQGGACSVDEEALEQCLATVQALDCGGLAAAVNERDEAQVRGLLAPCPGFLRCGRSLDEIDAAVGTDRVQHRGAGPAPRGGRRR